MDPLSLKATHLGYPQAVAQRAKIHLGLDLKAVRSQGKGGQHAAPEGMGFWTLFLRFSVVGYALVLLTSLYILWTFGRTDETAFGPILMATIVLALPGALGAAAARLIL